MYVFYQCTVVEWTFIFINAFSCKSDTPEVITNHHKANINHLVHHHHYHKYVHAPQLIASIWTIRLYRRQWIIIITLHNPLLLYKPIQHEPQKAKVQQAYETDDYVKYYFRTLTMHAVEISVWEKFTMIIYLWFHLFYYYYYIINIDKIS